MLAVSTSAPCATPNTARLSQCLVAVLVVLGAAALPRSTAAQAGDQASSSTGDSEAPSTIVITADAPEGPGGPGVHVVDAEEARRDGHRSVADVVEAIPGISIQSRGSDFEPSTVRIRGSTAEQVLVLRDGQPVGDAGSGTSDLSRVSLAGIERIEIVLGPATALFGGGGAAGAVNLVTGNAETPASIRDIGGRGSVGWGSLGEYRAAARLDASTGRTEADFSVDARLSENEYTYVRNGDGRRRSNAGGWMGSLQVGATHGDTRGQRALAAECRRRRGPSGRRRSARRR